MSSEGGGAAGEAPTLPANNTIYINNLNEKIKLEELKKSLHAIFSQFGKILEILAFKTLKHKGQAWVVFEDVSSATEALNRMQGFPFHDKIMRIQYAKTKSDIIAKADGTFVPRERRKKHDDRDLLSAEAERKDQQNDTYHTDLAYCGAYEAVQPLPFPGGAEIFEAPVLPNNILFVENLPHDATAMMLQMLFCQYPGFEEVRMVEAKPGIAFVEYEDETQSSVAMQSLNGFKITPHNPMQISFAKK